jgi:O-antigen ligase
MLRLTPAESSSDLSDTQVVTRNIRVSTIMLVIFLFLSAFDFRTNLGDSRIYVMSLSVISVFAGSLFILFTGRISKIIYALLLPTVFFLIVSLSSSLLRESSAYSTLSLVIPFVFFLLAIVGFSSLQLKKNQVETVLKIIVFFMFLSVLFKLFFAFYYYGLNIENVRYQIISPTMILLFSYGLVAVVYQKNNLGYIALLLVIAIVSLSVTRTYLLVFSTIVLFLAMATPFSFLKARFSLLKMALTPFVIILIAFVAYFIFPEIFDRWYLRLFSAIDSHGGVDVTAVTRIAEITYQINMLLESPYNLIFGLGISAETWFADEYHEVLRTVYSSDFEYSGRGFGHNTYIGALFTGGVIFGVIFVYALFNTVRKAFFYMRYQSKTKKYITTYHFMLVWGTCSAFGYLVYGFLGGIFGDRLMSLSFGLSFALIFIGIRGIEKYVK